MYEVEKHWFGDKPQIFGFVVMKSGPRRWLNTSLLRIFLDQMNVGDEQYWVELEQAGLKRGKT